MAMLGFCCISCVPTLGAPKTMTCAGGSESPAPCALASWSCLPNTGTPFFSDLPRCGSSFLSRQTDFQKCRVRCRWHRSQLLCVECGSDTTSQIGEFHTLFISKQRHANQFRRIGKSAQEGRMSRRIAFDIHQSLCMHRIANPPLQAPRCRYRVL